MEMLPSIKSNAFDYIKIGFGKAIASLMRQMHRHTHA